MAKTTTRLASLTLAALLSVALVPAAALTGLQQAWGEEAHISSTNEDYASAPFNSAQNATADQAGPALCDENDIAAYGFWDQVGSVGVWQDEGVTYTYKRLQYGIPSGIWRVSIIDISGASEVEIPTEIDAEHSVSWVNVDGNTEVKSINISPASSLQEFTWTNGSLSTLTIDGVKPLRSIDCNNNVLTELHLRNLTNCESVDCSHNLLASLDFDNLPQLTSLNCSYNKLALDLSSFSIADISSYSYTGSAIMPPITVKNGLVTLTEGSEYTVSYKNNVNAGTATVVVRGVGNCFGTITKTFKILPAEIKSVTLSSSSLTYDGSAKTPNIVVKSNLATLKEGTDYTISYRDNVNPGTATAVVTGIGNYSGVITKSFKIVKISLNAANVQVTKGSIAYSGNMLKPGAVVKVNGKTLRKGTDYTVSYKNNKNVGTATVTVAGKNAYTGTKTVTFKIVPKGTSVKKLAKGKKAFTVTWKKPSKANLKQITGYQVRWSTAKSMKGAKSKTVKATTSAGKKCSLKVSKLKANKKYYVQVRTYKKVGSKTYYSSWSKAKTVKTKK